MAKYARMSRADMQVVVSDPATPMIELSIAAIFAQCAKSGDYTRLAFLLDRSIGRPKEPEEMDELEEQIQAMTTEELVKLVQEKLPEIGKAG